MKKYISFIFLSLIMFSCGNNFIDGGIGKNKYENDLTLMHTRAFLGLEPQLVYNNSVIIKIKASDDTGIKAFLQKLNAAGASEDNIDEGLVDGEKYVTATVKGNYPETLAKIRGLDEVVYAEPNYKMDLVDGCRSKNVSPAGNILNLLKNGDSLFELKDGDFEKDPVADAQEYALGITEALRAYNEIGFGDNKVWAAIIDTGTNSTHEDLKYENSEKVCKIMRTIYDSYGQLMSSYTDFTGTNSDTGEIGHGTHCTGTIAAVGNNGKGIAGVAWKNVNFASYKAMTDTGGSMNGIYGGLKDLTDTIRKQVSQDVQATVPVNMSLGGSYASGYALEMINYALSKGVLPVVAMSNDGQSFPQYPAAFPGVLSVGATGGDDKKTGFSTWGSWINVCAPGLDIISLGHKSNNSYVYMSGTSMATPFVTGLVTYLLSFNRSLTPYQIISILEQSADKVDNFNKDPGGKYDENGFSKWYGYGRVNVYKAARMVTSGNIPKKNEVYLETVLNVTSTYEGNHVYVYDTKDVCVTMGIIKSGKVQIRGLRPGKYKVVCRGNSKSVEMGKDHDVTISF